ncbi:MAG TPA: 7-carboxy-7-deazaguanine synthase QueE [Aquifex aeolicus]|nr:7-carboxy-7-deazaguanine synthase QueE [Aquifex aeolicus]
MLRDKVRKTNTLIAINEIYESIQGEGLLVGLPSIFIRLQGCNLRCPWCDQPEALSFKKNTRKLSDLMKEFASFSAKHVVITGGEPFAHKELPTLVETLLDEGYSVQIETNGTLWIEDMDGLASRIHITCSPKAVARFFVHPKILLYAKELKFVVDEELNKEVLLRDEFKEFLRKGRVVLQPESNRKDMLEKAISLQKGLLKENFTVRVIPQVHKCFQIK